MSWAGLAMVYTKKLLSAIMNTDLPIGWTSETSNRFFSTSSGEDRILYSSEDVPWRSSTNPEASSPCRFGMDRHLWAPWKLSRRLTNFVNPNRAPKWNKVSRLLAALFGQFPRSDQSSDKLYSILERKTLKLIITRWRKWAGREADGGVGESICEPFRVFH